MIHRKALFSAGSTTQEKLSSRFDSASLKLCCLIDFQENVALFPEMARLLKETANAKPRVHLKGAFDSQVKAQLANNACTYWR